MSEIAYDIIESIQPGQEHACYETIHFVFAQNIHLELLLHLIVVFVCAASRSHHAKLIGSRAIESFMIFFEVFDKLDAAIYAFSLEIDEIQATAFIRRLKFSCEIDQFCQ